MRLTTAVATFFTIDYHLVQSALHDGNSAKLAERVPATQSDKQNITSIINVDDYPEGTLNATAWSLIVRDFFQLLIEY